MTSADTSIAQSRIAHLAACLPVHRAFGWLHLHERQLRQWQLAMLAIPAPPFAEEARAAWFLERFEALGLEQVGLDSAGNALGVLGGSASGPVLLVSAHLDTVFPSSASTVPREDGPRILGPGACDNAAGLTALLALVAAFGHACIRPPVPILFAANVGEEGEGNLRGMRHIFDRGAYRGRIAAALALEGSGTGVAVNRALGSRRLRVTVAGPGGHSWTDAATIPNPIVLLSRAITALTAVPAGLSGPLALSTPGAAGDLTLSPGLISGGTSINSIPESAEVLLDLRSTDPAALDAAVAAVHTTFDNLVEPPARCLVEVIGDRPAATLPDDSPVLTTLRAVDRHLSIRTELRLGSTDANIPLSLGIPALAMAAGGTGGGIHTLAEWYDPTGRELALRRLLLTILDITHRLARNLLP